MSITPSRIESMVWQKSDVVVKQVEVHVWMHWYISGLIWHQNEHSCIQTCIPGISSQIHSLSPYAWPLRALRSQTCALAQMEEVQILQWRWQKAYIHTIQYSKDTQIHSLQPLKLKFNTYRIAEIYSISIILWSSTPLQSMVVPEFTIADVNELVNKVKTTTSPARMKQLVV